MSQIKYIAGKEPHAKETRVVFKNVDREGWDPSIETYLKDGGYEQQKKAFKMEPGDITSEVKTAGLRGRGGAGFPAASSGAFFLPTTTSLSISFATLTNPSQEPSKIDTSSTRTLTS